MDTYSKKERSAIMRSVRGRDTKPELQVRRTVHAMGFRYRLHRKDLPGRPDLTFPRMRKVIFVHGCFWHRHGCKRTTTPADNGEYWAAKFARNIERDAENLRMLEAACWRALVVWECELHDHAAAEERIRCFLAEG